MTKYTGKIQYNGVKASDSDVKELLSTLTSKTKEAYSSQGVGFLYVLIKGYGAPADIHLGWRWNKGAEKGDWGVLKDE